MSSTAKNIAHPKRSLLVTMIVIPLALFIALGMASSALVRCGLGLLGDQAGDEPRVGLWALANLVLIPIEFVLFSAIVIGEVMHLGQTGLAAFLILLFVPLGLISVPAYYWAAWAKEVPWLGWKFDVPFHTDVIMQTEGQLLGVRALTLLTVIFARVRLFLLELSDALGSTTTEAKDAQPKP